LLRPDIYFEAYKNLYANNGAATRGVDNDTADGFSEAKIDKIIKSLSDETYTPKSVRRTYIDKGNGKKRPLGIPTFTDKLVQEALRMVLEAVYEPSFLDWSHGFRPNRSCHTALASLKKEFTGARWFVEGDIKGCFDNIDHAVLISMLNKKVKDARIVKLIYKFLKAGYMENWQYHNTYSGTPQGGIISPMHMPISPFKFSVFQMILFSRSTGKNRPRTVMISCSTDSNIIVSITPPSSSLILVRILPRDKRGRFSGAHFSSNSPTLEYLLTQLK
jgi:RNA-directed DNA polymerase